MPNVISVTSASQFDELIQDCKKAILVDFGASWCAPCRALFPILERIALASQRLLLLKVDVDKLPDLAARFQVRSLPTVILFTRGERQDQFQGAKTESQVQTFLKPYLQLPFEVVLERAQAANTDQQLALLREAAQMAPDYAEACLPLLRWLLQEGSEAAIQEAQSVIQHLRFEVQRDPAISQIQSRLGWLNKARLLSNDHAQDGHDLIDVQQLAAQGNFTQALNILFERLPKSTKPERERELIVELLNVLSDRDMANKYRRQLFSLN